MTTMILMTPYLAFVLGVAMMMRVLHLYSETRPQTAESTWRKFALLFCAILALPTLAHAQAVDLKTATESGNAIIMYLSGTLAAVGIVARRCGDDDGSSVHREPMVTRIAFERLHEQLTTTEEMLEEALAERGED